MATDVHTNQQESVASLVGGIVDDVQTLLKQHLQLFRQETKEDLRKTKQAAFPLVVGFGILGLGGLLLCFTLVYLLHWALAPRVELWVCYAIVSGAFLLVGAIFALVGKKRFDSFNPLPDQTLEEIQWTIKPTTKPK